ncbi:MAG TPA: TIGR01777 family oxidoreductase [Myxococcaceae bacterium]|nr:TIGR01777 family oxidoreductase [Myxococcaceae bacterium]
MDEQRYLARSPMPAPARELFDWHARSGAFERLNPPFDRVEVLERSGGLAPGARTVVRLHLGPLPRSFVAVHTALDPGRSFTDRQESGPFARWEHVHRMIPDGEHRSLLEDEVRYALPLGPLGRLGAGLARERLESLFAYRHALTAADLARHAELAGPPLRVGITGSHGLIGDALAHFLTTGGHVVVRLGRGEQAGEVDGLDAVVNLAGSNVGAGRWTEARKREILESRVRTTQAVVDGILRAAHRPTVLVNGSATGYYGDRGEAPVDEASSRGTGFLAEVVEAWEAATRPAEQLGVRVVKLRTGVVLTPDGGALARMLPIFKAGAGGKLGSGKQVFSWISLEDVIGAIHFALRTPSLHGVANLTAPEPVTNAAFAHVLGRVLHRPTVASVPAPVIRAAFGQMGQESVLSGANVVPRALLDAGFRFRWPGLEGAVRFCLGKVRLPSAG